MHYYVTLKEDVINQINNQNQNTSDTRSEFAANITNVCPRAKEDCMYTAFSPA